MVSILYFLSSCSGYRLQSRKNPFAQYGVKKIYVPMFYNQGNLGNISGVFTKEILDVLSDFKGLILTRGKSESDAVLIGIIDTPKKLKDSSEVTAVKRVSNTYGEDALGQNRDDFKAPSVNTVSISVRLIVIKKPTSEEIKFFQNSLSENALSSKIIFNEKINLSGNYSLKELQGSSQLVLNSQNRGVEKQLIDQLAKDTATSFKDMIIYVF